jgi:hypothetical protein
VSDSRVKKIKTHFIDHKELYIGLGVGMTVAGITYTMMRDRHATLLSGVDGLKTAEASVTVRPFSFFSSQKNEIVTTIHTGDRGNPGFLTRNIDYDLLFPTQGSAARAFGISPSILSSHLNGKIDSVDGLHFERICMAA